MTLKGQVDMMTSNNSDTSPATENAPLTLLVTDCSGDLLSGIRLLVSDLHALHDTTICPLVNRDLTRLFVRPYDHLPAGGSCNFSQDLNPMHRVFAASPLAILAS